MDKLFASHDKDMNGKLSWREFVGEESKNERVFKLMDANRDGKISKHVSKNQFEILSELGEFIRLELLFESSDYTFVNPILDRGLVGGFHHPLLYFFL